MHPRLLQQNIVEKVLRDREGRLARVTFHVYESEGHLKARVLHVEYLEEKAVARGPVLALAGATNESAVEPEKGAAPQAVASPFADLFFIYRIGSQPRAPSFQ